LKAWENGNMDEAVKDFADTVTVTWDYYDARLSKDSVRALIAEGRKHLKNATIKMDDYESVISKDKKNEWVSLWYKQIMMDDKGKIDSVYEMDDMKIVNGKIAILDEKSRHYPAAKS